MTTHVCKFRLLLVFLCFSLFTAAQRVVRLASDRPVSLRGLSAVDDRIIWVSGSKGTVGRSIDGGKHWTWFTVKGFEQVDFRDIEAFDEKTAVIMGIAEPGYILKTFNGGESWKLVYADSSKGVFFDAMEFWDDGRGMLIGDPLQGRMYMARCVDFGNEWKRTDSAKLPELAPGEAFFASSGTNVRPLNYEEACIVTGGSRSRMYVRGKLTNLPLLQGGESTGANSVAVWFRNRKPKRIVVVGGDFSRDTLRDGNCVYSTNMGKHWQVPSVPPHGYRSCVEFTDSRTLVACGTSGVDISRDGGATWSLVTDEGYHVVRKAKYGKAVFLAGAKGRVAILEGF